MAEYNLGTASGRIVVDGSGAELGFNVAKTAAGAFFDVVKTRIDEVQSFGKKMAAAGAAGSLSLAGATKVAAGFEQQLSGLYAVANASEEQQDRLRQKALDLGAATSFSASESAAALEELIKAGISVEDALAGGADAAVALAAAGGTSIPEAAVIASNAMNQFNLSAKDVGGVADILAGVANTSAADVSTLGQSLSQAGAVANLTGLSFRDTAIALGQLSNAGINGSDAGTSLKTMLNNLIPVTKAQTNEFKRLGLLTTDLGRANKALAKITGEDAKQSFEEVEKSLAKYVETQGDGERGTVKNADAVQKLLMQYGGLNNQFFDAQGNIKNLGDLQGVLAKSMKGMTKEQKLASLEMLFGADAMRATAILAKQGKKGYEDFAKGVDSTKAADVAKVRLDNLAGAQEALSGSLETAAITIGSVFLPVITKMIQALTWLVNGFNSLPGPIKTGIAILMAVVSAGFLVVGMIIALLPLIISMLVNFLALRAIKGVVGGFRVFFATLKAGTGTMAAARIGAMTTGTAFQRLTARTLLASKATILFGKAMLFLGRTMKAVLLNPYVLAILAIVGLGVLLYKKWEPFRELVDKIAAFLQNQMVAAWRALQPAIAAVGEMIQELVAVFQRDFMPVLREVGGKLFKQLQKSFREIWAVIQAELIPAVLGLAQTFQDDVLPALKDLWVTIQPALKALGKMALIIGGVLVLAYMKWAKFLIGTVYPILLKIVGFLAGEAIKSVVGFIKGFVKAISGIINIFGGFIKFWKSVFTGDWQGAWDAIKQILNGALQLIAGLVKMFFSTILVTALKLGLQLLLLAMKAGWNLLVAAVKASLSLLWQAVRAGLILLLGLFIAFFTNPIGIARRAMRLLGVVVSAGMRAMVAIARGVGGAIASFFSGLWNRVKSNFSSSWNALKNLVQKGMRAAYQQVTKTGGDILEWFKSLPSKIKGALSGLVLDMFNMGKDLIRGMLNGVKAMASDLVGAVKGVVDGAKNKAKSILGIGSPSKLFHDYGVWTIQGQINGMVEQERPLVRAVANTVGAMAGAYRNMLGQIEPATLPTIDVAPIVSHADTARGVVSEQRAATATAVKERSGASEPRSRLVEGELSIDSSGRAWITGIARDADDDQEDYNDTIDRMN